MVLKDTGSTPLIAACEGGHSETAKLLIEKGADFKQEDWVTDIIIL